MHVAIIGATGLVGTALYQRLRQENVAITVVGRMRPTLRRRFPDAVAHLSWGDFDASDALSYDTIVNLAGSSVSGARWTAASKKVMYESRLSATRMCVKKCCENWGIHLINASAVSAYGFYPGKSLRFTEQNHAQRSGSAFLQDLIDTWEGAALEAEGFGSTVTLLRTGVVLDAAEGALPQMMKPYARFLGGPVGTGQQMMSWISSTDTARAIAFLVRRRDLTGPVNCTSPGACSNRRFARALGAAINRPSLVRTPAFVIRALMGQMGDELIVRGQHVYPEKLLYAGFEFSHPVIEDYLKQALSQR